MGDDPEHAPCDDVECEICRAKVAAGKMPATRLQQIIAKIRRLAKRERS